MLAGLHQQGQDEDDQDQDLRNHHQQRLQDGHKLQQGQQGGLRSGAGQVVEGHVLVKE